MFTLLYRFPVKPGKGLAFVQAWKEMTTLIHTHEGSLGSRLHRQNEKEYFSYAQWPDSDTWELSGPGLPEPAKAVRERMRSCCSNIETLFALEVVVDLLAKAPFHGTEDRA